MSRISIIILLGVAMTFSTESLSQNQGRTEEQVNQRVDELLATLSLTDKVGQMTQFAIDQLSVGDAYNVAEPHQLDMEKMRKVLVELRTGSILNVGGHAYTREHWNEIHTAIQELALEANGIPVVYGIDAIHGCNYTLGSTLYPQQIGLAATWNPVLVEELAEITAYETRASGIPWNFSPVLDIDRDPRWSRMWEGFGEDVHLVTRMGVAMSKGYQGSDIGNPESVSACLKHFMGYSLPQTGKDRTQAWIPERQLREYVMPMFQASIDAGAATIMINSADVNGVPVHASKRILTDLLRGEMGFDGVAVTDWDDITYLYTRHRVAKDYKDAIRIAINAGVDMAMVPNDLRFPVLLKELVEEGAVSMDRVDEAVRRVLALKVKLGLFETPVTQPEDYPEFNSDAFIAKAYQGAAECITLLKNENDVLPLKIGNKILVTGPTADNLNYLNGGWTWTWQGNEAKYHPEDKMTIVDAMREKFGEASITHIEGTTIDKAVNIADVVAAADDHDAVVICLGESTYTEKPGDIEDLTLSQAQIDLVNALRESNTPIVFVFAQGRPRIIKDIVDAASSIVYAYLPGLEGGPAIADVLAGSINPSGKLPFTYPGDVHDIVPYDHRGTDIQDATFGENGFQPEFEFGHGLSYTTFAYSNIKVSKQSVAMGTTFDVEVEIANTGDRPGKEVVQLYITDNVASVAPSVKRLRAFEKIELDAGQSTTITFTLSTRDLAFVGLDNKWSTEPGEFTASIGGISQDFAVK